MDNKEQEINNTSSPSSPSKTQILNHENNTISEKEKEPISQKEQIESNNVSEIIDLNKSGEHLNNNNNNNEENQEINYNEDQLSNQEIVEDDKNSNINNNTNEKGNSSQNNNNDNNNNNNNNNNDNYHTDQCGYCLICKCYDYGEITHNIVEDSEILKQSIRYSYVDDTSINSILAHRNYAEKEAIMKKYNDKYNKSLETELASHTHQKYKRTLISILTEPSIYDTLNIENSIKTKNSNTLLEILLTRTNEQKELIKRLYLVKYGKPIEHDIIAKFSNGASVNGNMIKQLLISMLNNERDSNSNSNSNQSLDMNLIKTDSNRLYQAGEHKKGTDYEVFIEILSKRSFSHLSELDTVYQNSNPKGHSLRKAIELEFGVLKSIKQVKISLLDILLFSKEPSKYWAEQFNRALTSGSWGVNEIDLTRLTITQQHQASKIKQAYISHYDNSLINEVSSKTSFRYKKIILSMLTV
ncbi:hypothetical protein ACTFIY_012379 [Dictyostelium cf. discoideum]